MNFRFKKRFVIIPALLVACFVFCRANYEVPILMYHRVGAGQHLNSSTDVSLQTFERQMEFLRIHHYNVISLLDLADLLRAQKRIPYNTVVITFDDGTLDNFENAFPVLKKMRFKATIFMITGNVGKEGWLSEEDLKILEGAGIQIGSHTHNHAFLPRVSIENAIAELQESRNRLEKILGHPIFLLSYPAGGVTKAVRQLSEQAGYQCAVTTNYASKRKEMWGGTRYDVMALRRVKISESRGSLFSFWLKVSGLYHLGKKRIPII